jgi:hypothetical protein
MDSYALSSQVTETSTSPEATGGEARWPEQQHDPTLVTFEFATLSLIPGDDGPSQHYYFVPVVIPIEELRGTVIANCLLDCGCTPNSLGTITVPGNIGLPDEKELMSCLRKWIYYLDNPSGNQFVAETCDEYTALFLDFIGVNARFIQHTRYHARPRSYAYNSSCAYMYDDELFMDDDKPQPATKELILHTQKRGKTRRHKVITDDEMYADWIVQFNIDELDFSL